jgi:hypothetical protein
MREAITSPDDDPCDHVTIRMTLRVPRPMWDATLTVAVSRGCTRVEAMRERIENGILQLSSEASSPSEQSSLPGSIRDLRCLPVLPSGLMVGCYSS